jgi:pentatricopeptide repeat protein
MYAKCGYLEDAVEVFRKLSKKDVVSWTGLVAGYAAFGHHEEALECYREMQLEGIAPSIVTFISILNCCGSMGALCMGREIHMQVSLRGLEGELFIGNSLIDVYMKCGASVEARAVFDRLPIRDVVSWTALATGHGQLGEIEHIYPILESMWRDGITPDLITFRAVLSACSHAGSVDMADSCFVNLVSCYALLPSCENYNCLIDLLVRAGHIEKALLAMEGMPFHPSAVAWHIILGSCHCWNNAEMGNDAFKHSIQMNEEDTAAYICMSNAYVNAAVADHTSINSPDMSASCM